MSADIQHLNEEKLKALDKQNNGKQAAEGNYFADPDNQAKQQQSKRRKSQGGFDENKSRKSSKSRLMEEDFPEPYSDLAKRAYEMAEKEGWPKEKVFELLKDPQKLIKKMEHRNVGGFEKPVDPVIERMQEDQRNRELKRQQLIEQQKKAEEEAFQKETKQKGQRTRTHEEFMADQIRFEQKRYEKLSMKINEEINETSTFKPALCKGSQKINSSKKQEEADNSVHMRLYSAKGTGRQQKSKEVPESDHKQEFTPQINKKSQKIKRDVKIEEHLQMDAKRRQEFRRQHEEQRKKQEEIPDEEKFKGPSKNSQKFVYNRFENDFKQLLEHQEGDEQLQVNNEKAMEILTQMGFLNQNAISLAERGLVDQLWKIANKNDEETISVMSLKVLMSAIMNFNKPWMIAQGTQREEQEQEEGENEENKKQSKGQADKSNKGVLEEGHLKLHEEEIPYFSRHFCLLQANRQDFVLNNKKVQHLQKYSDSQKKTQFRPELDSKSQKMLQNKNPKQEMGEDLSYHDYLIKRGQQYKEKQQKQAEQRQQESTGDCTFKPKILKKNKNGKDPQPEGEGKSDKCMELYKMAERKRGRTDRNKDDIEFEKYQSEYTFQPNPHKKHAKPRKASPSPQNAARRREHRAEVEERKKNERKHGSVPPTLRGMKPKQQEVYTFEDEDDHEAGEDPLYYAEVNIEGQMNKIALYQHTDPTKVAMKFAMEKNLNEEMTQQLIDLLHAQMQQNSAE